MKKPTKSQTALKEPGKTCQLKIELEGSSPRIWRQVLVPGHISLRRLDVVIQLVMGWENAHLHQFIIDKQFYSDPAFKLNEDGGAQQEHESTLEWLGEEFDPEAFDLEKINTFLKRF